jgi:hypothetical protein
MARIFNTIRQRLLKEDRLTRYLVYAIGEVVLVVVGILIALQVNNWNSERNARSEERDYMVALLDESILNSRILHGLVLSNRAAQKAADLIIAELGRPPGSSNMDTLHAALARTMTIGTTVVVSNIYKEMESSGKLKLLRNDSIRQAIVAFYASAELVYKLEEVGVTDPWNHMYTPFVNKHLDNNRILREWLPTSRTEMRSAIRPDLPFWDLPPNDALKVEFGNLLSTYYAGVWWVAGQQEKMMADAMNIQWLLRKELGITNAEPAQAPISPFER